MKGEAPGVSLGGMLSQLVHEVKIKCPADKLPEYLEISIENLQLDGSVAASEVKLPEGATLVGNPNETLISCPTPKGAEEVEETADDAPAEEGAEGSEGAAEADTEGGGGDAAE